MPKKATKRGSRDRQAAVRQNYRAEFNAPETGGENDPPIIVTGGSITIESPVEFTVTTEQRQHNGQPYTCYVYRNETIHIAEFEAKGKGNPYNDPTDGGRFNIKLKQGRVPGDKG